MESTGTPVVLSIAGSDSGGGAGIQADLRTFFSLGVFGATAVTCVTAQNPRTVAAVFPVEPETVALQIETVCDGFNVAAVKTGMLYSAGIASAVAGALARHTPPHLVVDPVMVATSGKRLLQTDAFHSLEEFLPLAEVVTPNVPEAEVLSGLNIASLEDMRAASEAISARYNVACVVKGGHIDTGSDVVNVLCAGNGTAVYAARRVAGADTHGTGCMFSAAVTAFLALQQPLEDAVRRAGIFMAETLEHRHPANVTGKGPAGGE
jgi:hydroxymethylpyrimidine/phosphomethylpyrimidine kinase